MRKFCPIALVGLFSSRVGLALITAMVSASVASAQVQPSNVTVTLDPVASGLTSPTALTHAGDGSGRLFLALQTGQVRVIQGGSMLPTSFLDLSTTIPALNAGFDERGLLGLAFHPNYENNGRFFVRYSKPRTGVLGEPCFGTSRGCHEEILSEFAVSAQDSNIANPASERILFRIDEPQFNHNGGNVAFGPDGHLYFGLGDGGGAHDGLADNPPSHGPIGNGQNVNAHLGKMLRIDVDSPPAPGLQYAVPQDNPFALGGGAPEIYAYGFRNPYMFSFDDGQGGDGRLLVADVGQNRFEELDIVQNGGNYGWVVREGFHCFDPFNPTVPPPTCATTGQFGEPLLDPVAEYDHTDGISIIGGFVYRGADFPSLSGKYIFSTSAGAFRCQTAVCSSPRPMATCRRSLSSETGPTTIRLGSSSREWAKTRTEMFTCLALPFSVRSARGARCCASPRSRAV